MAERWAVQSGAWSDTGTWNGGTLPGSGDTVHASGFEVLIDQSIEVDALSTAAGSSASNGGLFQVNDTVSDPITIDLALGILAEHYQSGNGASGSRTYILWIHSGSPEVTVNADVIRGGSGSYRSAIGVCVTGTASDGSGSANLIINSGLVTDTGLFGGGGTNSFAVRFDGTGSLTIEGDITGGSGSSAYGMNVAGGTVDITGDVTGSGGSAYGMNVAGGTVDITGDVTGGSGSAYGMNVAGGTVDITGDVTGGSGGSAYGMSVSGGTITVTGDVTGGGSGSAHGMNVAGGTVDITGDVTGGGGSAYGMSVSGSGAKTVSIDGDVLASASAEGVNAGGSGTGVVRVNGSITASAGFPGLASAGYNLTISTSGPIVNHENNMSGLSAHRWTLWGEDEFEWHAHRYETPSSEDTLPWILQRFPSGSPDPEHVRDGHSYGPPGDPRTGTLAVPPPESVAAGVPTDATVGTGAVHLADVAAVTGAQIAAATNAD